MLWPNGLKVQGSLALVSLFFSFLLVGKRNFEIINLRAICLFLLCISPLFVSVCWSHDLGRTVYELLKILPGILGCLALSQLLKGPEQLRNLATLQVVTACVTVLFAGALIYVFGSLRGTYRGITALQGISGIIASYVQLFVPIGICLVIAARKFRYRVIAFVLTQCCLVVAIYSATRAAMLALVISLFVLGLGLLGIRRFRLSYVGVLFLLAPLTVIAVRYPITPVLAQEFEQRVEKNLERGVVEVTKQRSRARTWRRAVEVYSNNPVTGIGFEAFSRKYWFINPHNIVLDYLLSAGAIGLLGVVLLFFSSMYGYVRGISVVRRYDVRSALYVAGFWAALVGVFVYGMFWQILWHPFFYLLSMVGLILGISLKPGMKSNYEIAVQRWQMDKIVN
jgi:O-antigen ligase